MTKRIYFAMLICLLLSPLKVWAEHDDPEHDVMKGEEVLKEGFLTHYLNKGISDFWQKDQSERLSYGQNVKSWVSAPQFGGFAVARYQYSSKEGAHGGNGFSARLVRAYVSGSVLRDFKYRIQIELKESVSMRDYQVEWARYDAFSVKMGQFKRPFTFENPMNTFALYTADITQATARLSGFGDYNGEPMSNGRDQGIQIQGSLLKTGYDHHPLLSYQLGVFNGNGMNRSDNNGKKDIIGNIKIQPVSNLVLGFFGWKGNYTQDGITVRRIRYALGMTYERSSWHFRTEYVHSVGHKISDYQNGTFQGTGRADAWYAVLAIPVTAWFKPSLAYDAYRDQANWSTLKTAYRLCGNFRLHENLLFQVEYQYNYDKMLRQGKRGYNAVFVESYIRF